MFSLHADSSQRFVEITLGGEIDFAERETALKEITSALETSGANRLLISYLDDAKVAFARFDESSSMATSLARDAILAKCRVAYVTPLGIRVDPVTEMLAYARGFTG